MEEVKVYTGTVVWFSKGFGFLAPDGGGNDVFCHYSDIVMEGYRTLKKGQRVQYQIGKNLRGQDKAVAVTVVE